MLGNKKVALIFLLPAAMLYVGGLLLPILWSISLSLFKWNGLGQMNFIGLENYVRLLFRDDMFYKVFTNNLIYTGISIVYQLGGGLLVALLITKINLGRNFFKTLYYAPVIISAVALSEVMLKFFGVNPIGVVNSFLELFNPEWSKVVWFGSIDNALPLIALSEGYKNVAIYMVIIYSALISIPLDILEAAKVEGAHGFKLFYHIELPLIKNMLLTCLILITNFSLKSFEFSFLITNGGPGSASELMATYMFKQAFISIDYGYASAIAVFMALESIMVIGIIKLIYNHYSERS